MKDLSITDLFLARQWLTTIGSAGKVEHTRQVADRIIDVDKELWSRLMLGRSPWEGAKKYTIKDPDFEQTLEDLQKGKLNDLGASSGENSQGNT